MDGKCVEELRRSYLVARLNVEKSERAVGHLARFLARRAIVLRLATIATEQQMAGPGGSEETDGPAQRFRAAIQPVPREVSEALRELREWRDAALHAYRQIPEAERETLGLPAKPWSMARSIAVPSLA